MFTYSDHHYLYITNSHYRIMSFEPIAKIGSEKYGKNGLFSSSSFKGTVFSASDKKLLKLAANHSLSSKTWSAYRTVENMLELCGSQTNVNLTLPMTENKTLVFVAWLMKRGLKSRSINSYLSGLRMLHLTKGVKQGAVRSDLIKQVLEGRLHIDSMNSRLHETPRRMPVTPTLLKLLKLELKESDLTRETKRLLWAVSTLAFSGGFRVGELLARVESTYDPLYTLLGQDIKVITLKIGQANVETIQVNIKSQKTDRVGVNCLIDVYESGGIICPVKAYNKWKDTATTRDSRKPAFRLDNGKPLTTSKFNKYLKSLLGGHIDYNKSKITGHSFRAGIASLLGNLGYSDSDIQAVGRWSSQAFQAYLKLPRTRRIEMAEKIGKLNIQ